MKKYIDLLIKPQAGMSPPIITSEIVSIVHYYSVNIPQSIALALPECAPGSNRQIGCTIRLFSNSEDHLNALSEIIEQNRVIKEMVIPTRIRNSPESPEYWVAYCRSRILRRKNSEKDTPEYASYRAKKRAEQIAMQDKLPTIFYTSKSNRHRFGIGIIVLESSNHGIEHNENALNTFGLSSSKTPFWLPKI